MGGKVAVLGESIAKMGLTVAKMGGKVAVLGEVSINYLFLSHFCYLYTKTLYF